MSIYDKLLAIAALIFIVAGSSMLVVLVCESTWIRLKGQTAAVMAAARRRRS